MSDEKLVSGGRWRLAPFELVAYGGLVPALLLLRLQGYAPDAASLAYVAEYIGVRLPTLLLVGLLCQVVAAALRRDLAGYFRRVFTREGLVLLARAWMALVAVTYAYTFLKLSVPIVREPLFDRELELADRLLHFGISPTVFAVELVRGTGLVRSIDLWYSLWLTSILYFQSATFWSADFAKRKNFLLACALLWLGGSWVYVALPALGPAYVAPETFAPIRSELPYATGLQGGLLSNYQQVVASRDGVRREVRPFLAIAAMPSLHVGGHFLLALWARRHARRLYLPCLLATGLTFFGSLVTGWHWAVDGWVGMLLAWGAVALADRWQPVAGTTGAKEGAEAVNEEEESSPAPADEQARPIAGHAEAVAAGADDRSVTAVGRSRLRLYPFELLTLGFVLFAWLVLRLRGFGANLESLVYTVRMIAPTLPLWIGVGFIVGLVAAATRRRAGAWSRDALSPASLELVARAWLAMILTSYAYMYLKVNVPILRASVFDAELEALDRFLHFGISPSVFAAELVRGTPIVGAIDAYYGFWITSIMLFQGAVLWSSNHVRRRNFLFAKGVVWILGVLVYIAVPAVGPCFVDPSTFDAIRDEMPHTARVQGELGRNYLTVVASRDGQPRAIIPKYGVAAMPSLHVGVHFLFALWARRHARRLYLPCLVATGLTFFGSLMTGWHWAVDGYVGMLLAWAAVALADRWEPVAEDTERAATESPIPSAESASAPANGSATANAEAPA